MTIAIPAGYIVRTTKAHEPALLPDVERAATTLYETVPHLCGWDPHVFANVCSERDLTAAREAGRLWVAADAADMAVGFALILRLGGLAHLEELDVVPQHGRRGIGAALLETVCLEALAAGYEAVTLSTFRDVPWNAPFYARRGFEIVDPADLSAAHERLVERELALGLRTDLRVVMRRQVTETRR